MVFLEVFLFSPLTKSYEERLNVLLHKGSLLAMSALTTVILLPKGPISMFVQRTIFSKFIG